MPVLILLMVVRVALGSQVDEEATVTTIVVMHINNLICKGNIRSIITTVN